MEAHVYHLVTWDADSRHSTTCDETSERINRVSVGKIYIEAAK